MIPKNIPNSIRLLNLSYNNIESIGDSLTDLRQLVSLDLSFNMIKKLEKEAFRGLKSLKSLYLNSNQIVNLASDVFTPLQSLTNLHLSHNKQLEIGEPFLVHQSLKELSLDNCDIDDFPDETFANLTQLERLTIEGNPLNQEFSASAFVPLRRLVKLRMPNVEDNVIKSLCNYLVSIDIITFDEYNISCTLLVESEYKVDEAIVNDTPEITLIRTVKAPATTATMLATTTVEPIIAQNQTIDVSTQRVNVTTSDGTSKNETSIDTEATRVVDIDKETINLILLGESARYYTAIIDWHLSTLEPIEIEEIWSVSFRISHVYRVTSSNICTIQTVFFLIFLQFDALVKSKIEIISGFQSSMRMNLSLNIKNWHFWSSESAWRCGGLI